MSRRYRIVRYAVLVLAGAAARLSPAEGLANPIDLKIRAQSSIQSGAVRLADVLVIPPGAEDALPANIRQAAVAAEVQGPATLVISYDQIAARLSELGVNSGRVLLGGAAKCVVKVSAPQNAPEVRQCAAVVGSNGVPAERTLAQALREHITAELSALGGSPEIEYERAGEPFLALTTPPWEFSIRSTNRNKLGPREFQVLLRRDGKNVRTATIMARVQLSKEVLVARAPLNVGTLVQREALGLEPRVFQREQDLGLGSFEQAVGQRVAKFIAAGQMVTAGDLKSEQLVQRSRPVTILGGSGNLTVRLAGVALDSGQYGETVRVRIGDSRQRRNVLHGRVTGISTVRIEEGRQCLAYP
jgi:flagella basal body P-ring formation protein FlgA